MTFGTKAGSDGYIGFLEIAAGKKTKPQAKIQIQVPGHNKSAREIVELIGRRVREAGINAVIFSSTVVQIDNVKNVVLKIMVQMRHNHYTAKTLNDLLRKFARILRDAEILNSPILSPVTKNNFALIMHN